MKINNDDLRKIYRTYIQNRIPLSREKCPSPEKLLSFFVSSGSRHKKGGIVDHITNCADCSQEFYLFLELHREERRLLEEIGKLLQQKDQMQISQKKSCNSSIFLWPKISCLRRSWIYAFASLVIIIFVAMMIFVTNQLIITQKNEERGGTLGQIRLIVPTHEKTVQAPLIFKWKAVKNSNYYLLEIFDEALSPVWKSQRIIENIYSLPPDVGGKIEKNKIYYWMITVFKSDGTAIESSLEDFTLIE